MDLLQLITNGFASALSLENIAYVLIGVSLGTVIGMLPGLGPVAGVSVLLPLTLGLDPLTALIMLAGLYYGAQYGGSISSILVGAPGDSAQVMTSIDGYQLARQGRAGPALAVAAIASGAAGLATIPLLMAFAPLLGTFALEFGPPEQFTLMLFGLVSVAGLTTGDRVKGLVMSALGVALSTVGLDPQTGLTRFTLGNPSLLTGIGLVPIVVGVFAIGEVLYQLRSGGSPVLRTRLRDMIPSREDLRWCGWPILRSSVLGFFTGVLPGAGATVGSFFGYAMEKRLSKRRRAFGAGTPEAVAAPEAANNAAVNGAFVPTLTLGIPGSATTAVLLGALLLHGIAPGPFFLQEQSELAWGLMASFFIGNLALIILNLPLAPVFASVLRIQYRFLYPAIIVIGSVGAYAVGTSVFSVLLVLIFGVLGYLIRLYGFPAAPLAIGFVLGGLIEPALAKTSRIAFGDLTILLTRPISAAFCVLTLLVLVGPPLWQLFYRKWQGGRRSISE